MPCSPFADAQGSFLHCKKTINCQCTYIHTTKAACVSPLHFLPNTNPSSAKAPSKETTTQNGISLTLEPLLC